MDDINEIINRLNELKKKYPNQMILMETRQCIVGFPIGEATIYKNKRDEIVIVNN